MEVHHLNLPTGRLKSWRRVINLPAILAPALKERSTSWGKANLGEPD